MLSVFNRRASSRDERCRNPCHGTVRLHDADDGWDRTHSERRSSSVAFLELHSGPAGAFIVASYFRLRFWALGLALVVFASFPYALQRT